MKSANGETTCASETGSRKKVSVHSSLDLTP